MKKIIYLAVPYAHSNWAIQNDRYNKVTKAAEILTKAGYLVFSPITHAHHITDGSKTWDFWKQLDIPILKVCGLLLILKLEGWEQSIGVNGELEVAEQFGITEMWIEESEIEEIATLIESWDYLGQFK